MDGGDDSVDAAFFCKAPELGDAIAGGAGDADFAHGFIVHAGQNGDGQEARAIGAHRSPGAGGLASGPDQGGPARSATVGTVCAWGGLGLCDDSKSVLSQSGLVVWAGTGDEGVVESETFSGRAGRGDLIVSCWHTSGRNRRVGELIARGRTP